MSRSRRIMILFIENRLASKQFFRGYASTAKELPLRRSKSYKIKSNKRAVDTYCFFKIESQAKRISLIELISIEFSLPYKALNLVAIGITKFMSYWKTKGSFSTNYKCFLSLIGMFTRQMRAVIAPPNPFISDLSNTSDEKVNVPRLHFLSTTMRKPRKRGQFYRKILFDSMLEATDMSYSCWKQC